MVLVETVGVGQSETAVADMVDSFLLLTLARTGDELQGIKKGVLELADVIAVNKADGPHERDARKARPRAGRRAAAAAPAGRRLEPAGADLQRRCDGTGLDTVWEQLEQHRDGCWRRPASWPRKRRDQQVDWTWAMVRDELLRRACARHPAVRALAPELEQQVRDGELTRHAGRRAHPGRVPRRHHDVSSFAHST